MLCCYARWSFALTGDQRAFRSPFGNLRAPSGWRSINLFVEGTNFIVKQTKAPLCKGGSAVRRWGIVLFRQSLLTRMQTEGVQGAIGKPPGCSTTDNKQKTILPTKNPPSPSGLGVMGQGPMALAGSRGGAPGGIPKGKALWSGCGAEPHKGAPPGQENIFSSSSYFSWVISASWVVPVSCTMYVQRP